MTRAHKEDPFAAAIRAIEAAAAVRRQKLEEVDAALATEIERLREVRTSGSSRSTT